jgi:hypothetical protein
MKRWRVRLVAAAVLVPAGWLVAWLLDFDPRPVPFLLLAVLACAVAWLVVDATDTGAAQWRPPDLGDEDRAEPSTPEHRAIDSHLASSAPSPVLQERLLALARERDPGLADPVLRDALLAPYHRMTPDEISRILDRIEAHRDR